MNRIIIHRKMESGEAQTDGAATCIYLAEVRDMMQAFARANTREGAERKLALKTLWRCSGRPGEPALISYEGLKWDTLHKCIFAESPQSKPSKVKLIPFVAGIDRHADWFVDYGDHLVLDRGRMTAGTEANWLLSGRGSPLRARAALACLPCTA
jgi:hypothetical protein